MTDDTELPPPVNSHPDPPQPAVRVTAEDEPCEECGQKVPASDRLMGLLLAGFCVVGLVIAADLILGQALSRAFGLNRDSSDG